MKDIMGIYNKGFENRRNYEGKWDEQNLEFEASGYFRYCAEFEVKPAKVGLQLWLGISNSTYWEWCNNKVAHPLKSIIMEQANAFMELQYIGRMEQYPTGNIFLLKSSHNHRDKQDIEITSGSDVSSDEIADVVSKLGLDKDK